jgi:hypothetical protein
MVSPYENGDQEEYKGCDELFQTPHDRYISANGQSRDSVHTRAVYSLTTVKLLLSYSGVGQIAVWYRSQHGNLMPVLHQILCQL